LRVSPQNRYILFVPRANLDSTDEAILEILVADGRRSASDVGRQVGLSPAAAKRRIDRLEEAGIITGYTATLDHEKLGSEIEAFAEVRFEASTQVGTIDEAFTGLPELVESFTMAGDPDALVRLRVTDLDHLKRVIDRMRRGGRIAGTKTLIVLGSRRGAG
jgi:DNA-binding Lrp family transcriptional regulator